ncbi:MAG TPA: DEAD/DEAH box helicase [Candidatus Thermoplasmatota archaeon]|nr:DEAD/DEAH box helicase [Candidatus Thermoplasmatota archaeon]
MPRYQRFEDLPLSPEVLDALDDMGFEEPSPIQREAIPVALQGRDLIGQAQTGTGKTAAFGIPLIERIDPRKKHVQVLILVPTRELAEQVAGELNEIGQYKRVDAVAVYGGAGFGPQLKAFKEGTPIVVGTPGRVMDHMRRRNLHLDHVQAFVLDEADRMLDMGFIEDIEWVMKRLPARIQIMLFSATMPTAIQNLAEAFMRNPVTVSVSEDKLTVEAIEQVYYNVGYRNKLWALYRVLESEKPELAFVFCRTKMEADKVAYQLKAHGYAAEPLHGAMTQGARNKVMDHAREGRTKIVVATDVLARGIDVSHCSHVINYDIPEDPEWYVHRIGRTGRMGKLGKAITFVTREESRALLDLGDVSGGDLRLEEVPDIEEGKDRIRKVIDWKEIADPTGMVLFEIDLGKESGRKMVEVFKAVNKKCGFDEHTLGRLRMHDRHTTIEVPWQVAPRFWETFRKGKLFDAPVHAQAVALKEK